jgi:transposase
LVRELTDDERARVEAGLRSSEAFPLRRCQIVLARARGERAPSIARHVGCDDQTVREAIQAFNERGVAALRRRSHRPKIIRAAVDPARAARLRALLHERPRTVGKPTRRWTLEFAAEVRFEQGLTSERVSDETIRVTLKRLGIGWKRAKRWITRPDPTSARKQWSRPPDPPGGEPSDLGPGLPGRGRVESPGAAGPAQVGRAQPAAPAGRAGGREGCCGPPGAGLRRPAAPLGNRRGRVAGGALAALRGWPPGQRRHD